MFQLRNLNVMNIEHRFNSPLARDLFALGVASMQAMQPPETEEEINEAAELREEDRRNKVAARFAEMDRRDRSGPQY